MNKLISASGIVYILFVSFYNLYGDDFLPSYLDQAYFLVNSIFLAAAGIYIAIRTCNRIVSVISLTVGAYNIFLTIFNVLCLIKAGDSAIFVHNIVLSGYFVLIIFVVILIALINGGLDKK